MESERPASLPYVPDYDDLAQIPRDLRFHPVENARPTALTAAQIAAFNRDGFIRPVPLFDDAEINDLRLYFDALLEKTLAAGGNSYSIATAHRKYGRVWDLIRHPKIVACVKDLLGENVVGWGGHVFCKLPRDGKRVDWHQDAVYWPLTPSKTVTVWLAIDDADTQNACMRFIPGSHRHGPLTHLPSSAAEENVLNLKVADPLGYGGTPVDDVLTAGEVSLHNDLLLHGSEPNDSDRRRCGLTLRYCAADVRAYLGWTEKGIVVAGEDRDHHWLDAPRPAQE
jgi:non-heme Fe2+,alpha-ketoglutarate-dependent halogenase